MTQHASDSEVDTYRALLAVNQAREDKAMRGRAPAGPLGKGTPGSRLKSRCPAGVSLRVFARGLAAQKPDHPRSKDAIAWLASKRPIHKKQHAGPHGRGSWSK